MRLARPDRCILGAVLALLLAAEAVVPCSVRRAIWQVDRKDAHKGPKGHSA
jgi:hypothetical protein